MIQLAALPATGAAASPPGILADQAADAPANGGFSDILALLQDSGTKTDAAAPGLAILQAPAAAPGKILPLLAAEAPAAPEAGPPGEDRLPESAGQQLHPLPKALPALLAAVRMIRLPAEAGTAHKDAADQPAGPARPETQDAPLAVPVVAMPAEPTLPEPRGTPDAEKGERGLARAALPAVINRQMHGLPLQAPKTPVPAPAAERASEHADAIRLLPVAALRPDAAPAATGFTLGETRLPQTGTVTHLRTVPAGTADTLADDTAAPAATALPGMAQPAAAMDTSASAIGAGAATTAPAGAPHDFSTLVDRLIEARDAARPGGVDVAVNHAEFGKVSLHFRHDETGLSVSVASADPDFARAVQAAVPAPAASAGSDMASGQNAPQSSAQGLARQDAPPGQSAGPGENRSGGHSGGQPGHRRAAENRAATDPNAQAPATGRGRFA